MKTFYLLFWAFFITGINLYGQEVVDSTKVVVADSIKINEKKLKFGCGFGLNFVGGTSLSLSPNLTYSATKDISFSAGLQGSYNAIKNLQKTSTYGLSASGIYSPIKNMQTLIEFVQLRANTSTEIGTERISKNFWDSALFIGAGYNITNKISIGAKYNLLYKANESVYSSAVIPYVNISF